ncbi:MAG: diguanylate cyclase [Alphaproteobacteria bacterium]
MSLPATKDMVDGVIKVLVIESGLLSRAALERTSVRGMTDGVGWIDLHTLTARDVGDAVGHLQEGRVDAVLMDARDLADAAWLRGRARELAILAVVDDEQIEMARRAIGAGAEDVLLPTDLGNEKELGRRVALAIARKATEHVQRRHAREDVLTGLANDTLLEERFVRAQARADRYATLVGLVAIDLDGLDALTAAYGKGIADHLLPKIGQRLLGEIRQTDTLARTRDHGFTWLVEGIPTIDDFGALVDRLPNQLARPIAIDNRQIRVTVSVGVAVSPFHGRDFQTVHGMAEAAMIDVSSISGDGLLMLPVPAIAKTARTQAVNAIAELVD